MPEEYPLDSHNEIHKPAMKTPDVIGAGSTAALGDLAMWPNGAPASEPDIDMRIKYKNDKHREEFGGRVAGLVGVMVARDNLIVSENNTSAGTLLREAMEEETSMDATTWNNFSTRVRDLGILIFERSHRYSNKITKAYMDCDRLEQFIQIGDLPEYLADEIAELEDGEPDVMSKLLRDGLDAIHTRHTGAIAHPRAKRK